ncbi:DUF1707 domain-containing protein [Glycomyces sp. L485]|uniref:DUF1707 SHOCT-like domain-containing protein n=1 Tax=Glycomyces sp. L485 TaxID=2909235 RepID=UPI001F4B99CE|nr:DUF1707 domain-containing protein [Glycomyces sp. L485]MCH7229343.1 DUF1707 domain-containing protein [Glycomyces sp. L485]
MSTPDPSMRVSNAERESIIAKLHAATEEGRLELDEFAERSREAYAARTYGELEGLLADLPDTDGQLAARGEASPEARRAANTPAELRLSPKASAIQRKGEWLAPRRIVLDAKASSVKLDFSSAVIGTREVDVEIDAGASSVELILPDGAYADDELDLMAGAVKNLCEYKGMQGLRFNVTGKARASSVKIRFQHRFLWWRW